MFKRSVNMTMHRSAGAVKAWMAMAMLLAVAFFPRNAGGCAAPVFRYVLERWPADVCTLIVFHRGPMTGTETIMSNLLTARCENPQAPINVVIRWEDVDHLQDPALMDLWSKSTEKPLPWAMLLYPEPGGMRRQQMSGRLPPAAMGRPLPPGMPPGMPGAKSVAWEGPAIADELGRVLDSPVRQEIARRILGGDSAVWLFIPGGNAPRDAASLGALTNRLAQLETELSLPTDEPANPSLNVHSALPLRLSFPVVMARRDDPAERNFVNMLEHAMQPPLPAGEAHVFYFFGKGRVMNGAAENGLTPEAIKQACAFLVQSCSCMIKDQVQGMSFHVPMAANWRPVDRQPGNPIDLSVPTLPTPSAP